MSYVCAFTGHRDLKDTDFDLSLLDRVISNCVKTGADTFLCGMAKGFDLEAAQSVLAIKNKCGVKLVACLPCLDQAHSYSESEKRIYNQVLARCDEINIYSDTYRNGCMQGRDRYMVDNCDVVISFLRKKEGGTHYTVKYASKSGKKVIEL